MKWVALLLLNSVPIICLTLVAIHFEKWWIVLFALLFGFNYKSSDKEGGKDENA